MPARRSLEQILNNYIPEPNTGCHLWTGATVGGYGIVMGRSVLGESVVTRIAWTNAHGPIPGKMKVCHRCDTPVCMNLEHLFLGTQAQNIRDMVAKGRKPRGEQFRSAKLTVDKVRAMRAAYATGNVTTRRLAVQFGIGPTVAFLVVTGKRWRHVT